MEIWTIEVLDGRFSASRWADAHGEALAEAAVTHRAADWRRILRPWGVVLEFEFADEADWLRFRATPAVQAALDATPDPVNGVHVYRGPGGSSGVGEPRSPRPLAGAGAAALPEPEPELRASAEAWLDPPAGRRVGEGVA